MDSELQEAFRRLLYIAVDGMVRSNTEKQENYEAIHMVYDWIDESLGVPISGIRCVHCNELIVPVDEPGTYCHLGFLTSPIVCSSKTIRRETVATPAV